MTSNPCLRNPKVQFSCLQDSSTLIYLFEILHFKNYQNSGPPLNQFWPQKGKKSMPILFEFSLNTHLSANKNTNKYLYIVFLVADDFNNDAISNPQWYNTDLIRQGLFMKIKQTSLWQLHSFSMMVTVYIYILELLIHNTWCLKKKWD